MTNRQNPGVLWKQRFQLTYRELQVKERAWRDLEGVLRLLATWLILAVDRSDDRLNRHLEEVRVTLRKDQNGQSLRALLPGISDGVHRLENLRRADTGAMDAASLVGGLLYRFPAEAGMQQERSRLIEAMQQMGSAEEKEALLARCGAWIRGVLAVPEPGPALEVNVRGTGSDALAVVHEFFAAVVNQLRSGDPAGDSLSSVVRRLEAILAAQDLAGMKQGLADLVSALSVGSVTGDHDHHGMARLLMKLLDRLEFPAELSSQADLVRQRLQGDVAGDVIEGSLVDIADLVERTRLMVQRGKEDLERFLDAVTRQLAELDDYLGAQLDRAQESSERRMQLGASLDSHLNEVASTLDSSDDLAAIRIIVKEQLTVIQERLASDRDSEREQGEFQRLEISRLKGRLQQLEGEVDVLRATVASEKDRASHDPLTGLPNRGAYDRFIGREFARWSRYGQPLCVAVLDVDHFKRVNDSYGHKTGDRVLQTLAELFRNRVREVDFVARYGGEEFVLVMPETPALSGSRLLEELREAVASCRFRYRDAVVPVTISAGVADVIDGDTPDTLFERADDALYKAKQAGRNRCLVWEDDLGTQELKQA